MAQTREQKDGRRRHQTCIKYDARNKEKPIEVRVTVKGGKAFIEYFAKNEMKKALEFRAWAYTQRANGKILAKHSQTFREFAEQYYKNKRAISKRRETSDIATFSSLGANVYPYIGNMDITKIKMIHITEMQTK